MDFRQFVLQSHWYQKFFTSHTPYFINCRSHYELISLPIFFCDIWTWIKFWYLNVKSHHFYSMRAKMSWWGNLCFKLVNKFWNGTHFICSKLGLKKPVSHSLKTAIGLMNSKVLYSNQNNIMSYRLSDQLTAFIAPNDPSFRCFGTCAHFDECFSDTHRHSQSIASIVFSIHIVSLSARL